VAIGDGQPLPPKATKRGRGPNDPVPADIARLTGVVGRRMDITFELAGFGP
jgi:hypothetical protein